MNLKIGYINQFIYINSNSQAALASVTQTSRILENCKTILNTLTERNKVIPGDFDIKGNEAADEQAKVCEI